MRRRSFLEAVATASLGGGVKLGWGMASPGTEKAHEQTSPETILLKDYKPRSLYKIPITDVLKAKFPIIDMHSHAYAKTPEEISE